MWGQIIGAVAGGLLSNQAARADRKAQAEANAQNMAGFNLYKPHLAKNLQGGTDALGGVLSTGAYTGPTLAAPNQFQTDTANQMGGYGLDLQRSGFGMLGSNAGFGQNFRDLYGGVLSSDNLNRAIDYAGQNAGALTDAVMRDDTRALTEQTLPALSMAASGSGNTNSSRAGVAEAIARRGYGDRRADVQANITNNLIDRSLAAQAQQFQNAMAANEGIGRAYGQGMATLGQGGNFGMNAGGFLQAQEQARLAAQQAAFERQRDFELNQRKGFQSGMLGRAPNSGGAVANMHNPAMAGFGGALQGWGFGGDMQNKLPTNFGGYGSYGGGAPPMRPASFGMRA